MPDTVDPTQDGRTLPATPILGESSAVNRSEGVGLLPWALLYIVDENGCDTGFGAVRSPIGGDDYETLGQFRTCRRLVGLTSYGTFPRVHPVFDGPELAATGSDGRNRPEVAMCDLWAHCFRDPDSYLPSNRPRILLSLSDFTDPDWVEESGSGSGSSAKTWDIIYVCCANSFNEQTKNWALAKVCLSRLCQELGTTVLLVGRDEAPDVPRLPGIDVCGELPWHELMKCISASRVVLLPNQLDASPVLLTEALCLDVPVVVNRSILGGWKYVVPSTGRFFDDEQNVVGAVASCLEGPTAPRAWFCSNYGPAHAGRRLADFLQKQGGYPLPSPARAFRHAEFTNQLLA